MDLPGTVSRQPKSGAHLVDDEQGIVRVAEAAQAARIIDGRQELVREDLVPERGREYAGDIALTALEGRLQAVEVVVVEADDVGPVLGHDPLRARRVPRRGAVIGAARDEDLATVAIGPRGDHCHGGRVAAVLAEHGPVGMGDHADEVFGQHDHGLGRACHRVAEGRLGGGRPFDLGVPVAQKIGTEGAHVVDISVAVGIPQIGALGAREILRETVRQQRDGFMPVHAARDHLAGALAKLRISGVFHHSSRSWKDGAGCRNDQGVMGGRWRWKGTASSKTAAACRTPRSLKRRLTICRPTGRPAAVRPHGMLAAGWLDMLNG